MPINLSRFPLRTFVFGIFAAVLRLAPASGFAIDEDYGVTAITVPSGSGAFGVNQPLTVTVENFSVVPSGQFYNGLFIRNINFLITVRLNGSISEQYVTRLNSPSTFLSPGTSQSVSDFMRLPDLSAPGSYEITVGTTGLPADFNSSNNATSVMVETINPYSTDVINSYPYSEDFESGPGGWTSHVLTGSGSANDWELGTPAGDLIVGANSGTNAWVTDLDGSYTSPTFSPSFDTRTESQVVSPLFDLTNIPLFEVSLAVWWETPILGAGANFQMSEDNGSTWSTIGSASDPDNWYSSSAVRGLDNSGNDDGWAGYNTAGTTTNDPGYSTSGSYSDGSGSWLTAMNRAQGGSSQTRFRVYFGATQDSFPDEGFAFDDVAITPALTSTQTVALQADNDSNMVISSGDEVRFTVTLTNNISSTLSVVGYSDAVNDPNLDLVPGSVTVTQGTIGSGNGAMDTTVAVLAGTMGTLAPGTTVTITFDAVVSGSPLTTEICSQGEVGAQEFGPTVVQKTDDPNTVVRSDPTCLNGVLEALGNSMLIVSGDLMPSTADATDYGTVLTSATSSAVFTLQNNGASAITFAGSPPVSIGGARPGDFIVTAQPGVTTLNPGDSTTFTLQFKPTAEGLRTATVSIPSSAPGSPYTFGVQGTGDLDTDGDGDPDSSDPDDDNDGVSDNDEMMDGTDPKDPGSVKERFGGEVCVEWNGFTDFLSQIFELRNTDGSPITVEFNFYDRFGALQNTLTFGLNSGIQRDLVLNEFSGFIPNSFGLACAKIVSGAAEALDGQLSSYRFTATSYDLAYVAEFLPARFGKQCVIYNTFQPSGNPLQFGNFVANWIQLVNEEATSQTGTLDFYDFEGVMVRSDSLVIAPNERRDIDAHTLGSSLSGLACWNPTLATAKFRMRENRYYYGALGLSDLLAANSISALRGAGAKLIAPFDTTGKTIGVEIANVSNKAITVSTEVRDSAGALTPVQPPLLGIPAKGTRGLVLNDYLASGLGNLQISSGEAGSLIVVLVDYGRAADGSLQYANPSYPVPALDSTLTASYNSFLAQGCVAQIASCSAVDEMATLTMTRFDGTVLINGQSINIPANGTLEFNLCSQESQQAYGEVRVNASTSDVLAGRVVRENAEGTVQIGSKFTQ